MKQDNLTNEQIKKKYDKYFDLINEDSVLKNSLVNQESYFHIKTEEERLQEPTIYDLRELLEEFEYIKSITISQWLNTIVVAPFSGFPLSRE